MARNNAYQSIFYTLLLILAASLALTGCGKDEETETGSPDNSPQMVERQAPARQASTASESSTAKDKDNFRVMPKMEGSLEEDGMGLETIIDASNKQAYADSLEWIAEDVSKQQFDRLESSIRYIHMYDSSVFGNENKLMSLIDGKTGKEIIDHAKQLRDQRR